MDILSKTNDEIFEIAKPIWDNLVRSSNLKDYGGFTKDFSTQMLFGANEVELGKQWANNKIITNLFCLIFSLNKILYKTTFHEGTVENVN